MLRRSKKKKLSQEGQRDVGSSTLATSFFFCHLRPEAAKIILARPLEAAAEERASNLGNNDRIFVLSPSNHHLRGEEEE